VRGWENLVGTASISVNDYATGALVAQGTFFGFKRRKALWLSLPGCVEATRHRQAAHLRRWRWRFASETLAKAVPRPGRCCCSASRDPGNRATGRGRMATSTAAGRQSGCSDLRIATLQGMAVVARDGVSRERLNALARPSDRPPGRKPVPGPKHRGSPEQSSQFAKHCLWKIRTMSYIVSFGRRSPGT
jgi:hypothetical protein